MSPKRVWAFNITFSAVFCIALIVLASLHFIDMAMSVTFGLILLIFSLIMYFRQDSDRFRQDERIRRLNLRATNLSWLLTLIGVSALYWLDHLKMLVLSPAQIYLALLLFMPYSFLLLALIFRKSGDVGE